MFLCGIQPSHYLIIGKGGLTNKGICGRATRCGQPVLPLESRQLPPGFQPRIDHGDARSSGGSFGWTHSFQHRGREAEWNCISSEKIEVSGQDVIGEITDRDDRRGAAGSNPGSEDTGRRAGSSVVRPRPGFQIQTSGGSPRPRRIRLRRSGSEAPQFPEFLHGGPRPDKSCSARSGDGCCARCRRHHRRSRDRLTHLVRRALFHRLRPGRRPPFLSFPIRFLRRQQCWYRLRRC